MSLIIYYIESFFTIRLDWHSSYIALDCKSLLFFVFMEKRINHLVFLVFVIGYL